ncbi:MAG TPA: XrtA system polysaccharide deacetylase [Bryobacteraceae bacterium]
MPIANILTIDLEEYFHPTEVQRSVAMEQWGSLPSRVEAQTQWVLEQLERHSVRATFFVLGWVAERFPKLVARIAAAGHEIGCHSYAHQLVYDLTPEQFRGDTRRALNAINDAIGGAAPVRAYRAPSYSITSRSLWALEILVECGIVCDSSIYPIAHDRYGIPGFERHAHTLRTPSGPILEVPIATSRLSHGALAPVGGGAYLRLLPYRYTAAGIRRVNRREGQPACIYFHPWEIDPDHPRLASGAASRLRTYTGMRGMRRKIERLLADFRFAALETVYPYEKVDRSGVSVSAAAF